MIAHCYCLISSFPKLLKIAKSNFFPSLSFCCTGLALTFHITAFWIINLSFSSHAITFVCAFNRLNLPFSQLWKKKSGKKSLTLKPLVKLSSEKLHVYLWNYDCLFFSIWLIQQFFYGTTVNNLFYTKNPAFYNRFRSLLKYIVMFAV